MPKWLKWILGILATLALLLFLAFLFISESLPKGQTGPEAEALANKVLKAINKPAWDNTGIVQWSFPGGHDYIWDKKRHLTEVKWGNNRALIDLQKVTGKAWTDGKEVTGAAGEKLVKEAWGYWCNDSFWLNAPAKVFDGGTERSVVTQKDGSKALMITYKGGGVTPGDSYLWSLDENGLPTGYKMWTSIIPIGGVSATWDDWQTLPTGAKIATSHELSMVGMKIPITNIKAAADLTSFGMTEDIFKPIL